MTDTVDKSVTEILADLRSTTSRLEKERILREQEENHKLKMIIHATIDPFSVFYITKIPDASHIPSEFEINEELESLPVDDVVCSLLSQLNSDSSRENIRGYFAILGEVFKNNQEGLDLVNTILSGDLNCGVSVSTVNKVWPKCIKVFDVMKAEEKEKLHTMRYPAYASLKMDGIRVVAFVRDGNVEIRSSSGRVFKKLPSITKDILDFEKKVKHKLYDGFILDGEMVGIDDDGKIMPRQISNGLSSKARTGSITDEDEAKLHFFAFDILSSVSQLEKGVDGRPLNDRISNLLYIEHNSHLRSIPSMIVNSEEEAIKVFNHYVSRGEEGIILKPVDSIYEAVRSTEWIKLKKEYQCEVEIIDWTEHTKKKGLLGSMTIQSDDGKVLGKIGTKLTFKQRKELYDLATEGKLIGNIITIVFHELTSSRGRETLSFYLPRFIEIREDKDEADSLDKIQSMM